MSFIIDCKTSVSVLLSAFFLLAACGNSANDAVSVDSGDGLNVEHGHLTAASSNASDEGAKGVLPTSSLGSDVKSAPSSASNNKPVRDISFAQKIAKLKPNTGLQLPHAKVIGVSNVKAIPGPVNRDYSRRMVYVPERQTALYVGGSHRTRRYNDVWEYHLASNTWQQLFPAEGGNHAKLKDAASKLLFMYEKNPRVEFSSAQRAQIEKSAQWWQQHVVLENGRITTRLGGPIMPSHTWDGLEYDASVGKLLWPVGASPLSTAQRYAFFSGLSQEQVEQHVDENYSSFWTFDPLTQQYGQIKKAPNMPRLRGMGASMVYLPDQQESIYYVSAPNVTPHEYGMYRYNARQNSWQPLSVNGGRSLRELVKRDGIAPGPELQMAYSAKHQKIVAVRQSSTYVFDLRTNYWSKVADTSWIRAHDNLSNFVYSPESDEFILAMPIGDKKLAAFSLATGQWRELKPRGDEMPVPGYKRSLSFWHPLLKVMVLRPDQGGAWVYKPG